jgi:Ni,Fe-hydrogenase I small subunit
MNIKKFEVKSCCGKSSTLLKTDKPVSKDFLQKLISLGYTPSEMFLKSGILYVDSDELTLTGSIGSNNLQAKCKKENCNEILSRFENSVADF